MSVIRLALDVSDPLMRHRVEVLFESCFHIKRAVQSDARHRVDAFWAAPRERDRHGSGQVRQRLGLSRASLEQAAYRHLDAASHLKRGCTKALAMHLADSVWPAVERHLFSDATGRRHGRPRIGRWWEFTRIPGRARSHTKANKWETFRIHGSLEGHRQAYTHNGRFHQPRAVQPVRAPTRGQGGWWRYDGPLVMVVTGLGVGDISLPVRLPAAPGNQSHLEHHLALPERWHKVDLVRTPDPTVGGGWRYEAHLAVLVAPYVSPDVAAKRVTAPLQRRAGGDLNVANFTVVSHDGGGRDVKVTRIARDDDQRAAQQQRRLKQRRRDRALERSRRNTNPTRYHLSVAQHQEQRRREAAGLDAKRHVPAGLRVARSDGKPTQAYRTDNLSNGYRRGRRRAAAEAAARTQRSKQAAREAAKQIVLTHGPHLVVEAVNVAVWARRWGRGIAAFTPGRLQQAMAAECEAVGGRTLRAGTRQTALSQHCLCRHRENKPLSLRVHHCRACGLRADRDTMAALLASHIHLTDPDDPATASVNWAAARRSLNDAAVWEVLDEQLQQVLGQQDGLSASTHTGPPAPTGYGCSDGPPAPSGSARRTAGQATGTTPQQPQPDTGTSVDSPVSNPCMPRNGGANASPQRDIS